MRNWLSGLWMVLALQFLGCHAGSAEAPAPARPAAPPAAVPAAAVARLPIHEVTVFKDGYAWVLQRGVMPVDGAGKVVLDNLPVPVLGTFWPYSADPKATLRTVTAGLQKVSTTRPALSLAELLEANTGAVVHLAALQGSQLITVDGTLLGVPSLGDDPATPGTTPDEEQSWGGSRRNAYRPAELLVRAGNVVVIKTADGTRVLPLSSVQDVSFRGEYHAQVPRSERRPLLTLQMDWGGQPVPKTADVGLMYVQYGLRWIPNYKVTLDGAGHAVVKLQATLINELADLDDVTANLMVGVPSFAFKEQTDPMAFQQMLARVAERLGGGQTARAFTNALTSQAFTPNRQREGDTDPAAGDAAALAVGTGIADSGKREDFYVFTVKHLNLKRGERAVLTVGEVTLPYTDVYTLDLPFAPPPGTSGGNRNDRSDREAQLARDLAAAKPQHAIRLRNAGTVPLTTAPALLLRGEQVLAQGMTRYTPPGGTCELALTTAVDLGSKVTESDAKRTPNAVVIEGNAFMRVDATGTISLINRGQAPVTLEVVRHVLGLVDSADSNGQTRMLATLDDDEADRLNLPRWWGWYGWPPAWRLLNGVGEITWQVQLEPGKPVQLGYAWHYFWR